jgi:sorbitol-specific phosphotransferase system component IIA
VVGGALVLAPSAAAGQSGTFMAPDDAPRALFPEASAVSKRIVAATPALQKDIVARLGRRPSMWEEAYAIYAVARDARPLGHVVVVEEIGKHRPITFAVGVEDGGALRDIVVLAYREAYGGEIKDKRFLRQYRGKTMAAPMLPYGDIINIAGATMSVQATGRAAHKAVAVLLAVGDLPE